MLHFRHKAILAFAFIFSVLLSTSVVSGPFDLSGSDRFESDTELVTATSLVSHSSLTAGKTYQAGIKIAIADGWHINSANPTKDFLIAAKVDIGAIEGVDVSVVSYPKGEEVYLSGDPMSVYSGETFIPFRITIQNNMSSGEYSLPISFTYQPCNNSECRAPMTVDIPLKITVGDEGELQHTDLFGSIENSQNVQSDVGSNEERNNEPVGELQQLIDEHGFWGYFLALGLAFVTGLLLSFSPCTYPMIPITVSIFAGQQRSIGKGFLLSLVYVGSMAFVYGIMGLIVSMVGGVFGAWLASPAVVIGIVIVFVIFALSMFGVYELQVPASWRQGLGTKAGGGGIAGSILLGVIAALVVSPCVGPFVAGILLYVATSGSPLVGFLVLYVFAVGLGTLYIIIGTFSSAINALPGSGGWMETVKKFFGFVLLMMALYFLKTIISPELLAVLTGLLLVAFGVFGGGLDRLTEEAGLFVRAKKFLGVLALIVGIYLLGGALISQGFIHPPANEWASFQGVSQGTHEKLEIPWETNLEAGLAKAKRENKPVLIDTWATWCVNCKVLEKKTFGKEEVVKAASCFVPIKVQLEKADTEISKAFMKRFGMRHYSLPTVLILDRTGNVDQVIQGVIGPSEMVERLGRVMK